MNTIDKQIEEAVQTIEGDPFSVTLWQALLVLVSRRNDILSKKTIEVIIGGLMVVSETTYSQKKFNLIQQLIPRVARSYNNASLIKQLGVIYINDFKAPAIARSHLELAKTLGCKDADLASLLQGLDAPAPAPNQPIAIKQAQTGAQTVKKTFRKTGRIPFLVKEPKGGVTVQPASQADFKENPSARLAAASEATALGKVDLAFRLLESLDPTAVDKDLLWGAWSDLGETCYKMEESVRAEESYRKACALRPDLMVSHFNLGTSLLMVNHFEDALKCFYQADVLEPKHPKVWCNIGSANFLQNDYAASETALRKCVALQPDYARAWDNLGSALGSQGNLDEAFVACTKAMELRPGYPEAAFKVGLIHFSQNRWSEALPLLMQTISCESLSGYAYAYLSMTFAILGNVLAAKRALANAEAALKDSEVLAAAWCTLGWAYIEGKELMEGRKAHSEAVRLSPESAEYWANLAEAHQALHEYQEAASCFQKSTTLARVANVA